MLRLKITLCSLVLLSFASACKVNNTSIHAPTGTSSTVAATNITTAISRTPKGAPTALPPAARVVAQTAALGRLTRVAGGTPQPVDLRRLIDASCQNGLMTIRTSLETIYAALPCDRFLDESAKQQFLAKDAAITLEVTADRYRVLIETLDGAQAEFTVDGIWLR